MVDDVKPEELEQFLVGIPHQLRVRFREAIKGVYASESEAVRDLIRRFAESRGC